MATTIASRVGYLREAAQVGRKRLSEECGLAATHVGQIERGEVAQPDVATLQAIAARTGAELLWLMLGEGHPPTPESVAALFPQGGEETRAAS